MLAVLETFDFCAISIIVVVAVNASVVYSYFRPADKARLRRLEEKMDLLLQRAGVGYEEPKEAVPLSDEVKGLAQDPEQKDKAIALYFHQAKVNMEEATKAVEAYIATLKK
jgi:NACalpha-BTF3-like transcription factor